MYEQFFFFPSCFCRPSWPPRAARPHLSGACCGQLSALLLGCQHAEERKRLLRAKRGEQTAGLRLIVRHESLTCARRRKRHRSFTKRTAIGTAHTPCSIASVPSQTSLAALTASVPQARCGSNADEHFCVLYPPKRPRSVAHAKELCYAPHCPKSKQGYFCYSSGGLVREKLKRKPA